MPTEVDYDLIVDAAYKAGFRDDDLVTAVAVSLAESGGNPGINNAGMNSNGTVDYGLWQINSVHGPDLGEIYDPYVNAEWAFKVFTGRNRTWAPWSAYNNGAYARHMTTARNVVNGYQPATVSTDGMVQGELTADPVQEQMRQSSPRLRAEQMLADVARAAKQRAQLNGENLLDKTPEEIRGEADSPTVIKDEDDDYDVLAELNGFLEARQVVADVGELPADNHDHDHDDEEAGGDGGFDGIPELTADEIARWSATGLRANAARGAAVARALGFNGSVGGVGSRPNASDHPHGNAIDLMTNDDMELGRTLAAFYVRFAEELGVKYVIFEQQIASASNGWEWRQMEDRGSPTANHTDHPHISFFGGS